MSNKAGLIEVVLAKRHTHQGKQKMVGDKINVSAEDKAWLLKRGIISDESVKKPVSDKS